KLHAVLERIAVRSPEPLPLHAAYLTHRPDVVEAFGRADALCGFILEFATESVPKEIDLLFDDSVIVRLEGIEAPFHQIAFPHYYNMLHDNFVHHREGVYGSGPPGTTVSPEVLGIARSLPEPILDFGCGSGALIGTLRKLGKEASGIELDQARIVESLDVSVKDHVTLYDGTTPLPYGDNSFASVSAIEVIEHISDYKAVLKEIFRVAEKQILITVPDMAGIPMLAHLGVVPWHLLEGTHVNFFTLNSLKETLDPLCRDVSFIRLHARDLDGSMWAGNLAALCKLA
ncbi:MAG: class I SAM-dependent methyltransferase, partial [Planctomycetota bacterium]|nr:class I SAM-dependent methyltransferase [Planctomycetota bacterium]